MENLPTCSLILSCIERIIDSKVTQGFIANLSESVRSVLAYSFSCLQTYPLTRLQPCLICYSRLHCSLHLIVVLQNHPLCPVLSIPLLVSTFYNRKRYSPRRHARSHTNGSRLLQLRAQKKHHSSFHLTVCYSSKL